MPFSSVPYMQAESGVRARTSAAVGQQFSQLGQNIGGVVESAGKMSQKRKTDARIYNQAMQARGVYVSILEEAMRQSPGSFKSAGIMNAEATMPKPLPGDSEANLAYLQNINNFISQTMEKATVAAQQKGEQRTTAEAVLRAINGTTERTVRGVSLPTAREGRPGVAPIGGTGRAASKQEAAGRFPPNVTTTGAGQVPGYATLPDQEPGIDLKQIKTAEEIRNLQARTRKTEAEATGEIGGQEDITKLHLDLQTRKVSVQRALTSARSKEAELKKTQGLAVQAQKSDYEYERKRYGDPASYKKPIQDAGKDVANSEKELEQIDAGMKNLEEISTSPALGAMMVARKDYATKEKRQQVLGAIQKVRQVFGAGGKMRTGAIGEGPNVPYTSVAGGPVEVTGAPPIGFEKFGPKERAEIMKIIPDYKSLPQEVRSLLSNVVTEGLFTKAEIGSDPDSLLTETGKVNLSSSVVQDALMAGYTIEQILQSDTLKQGASIGQ